MGSHFGSVLGHSSVKRGKTSFSKWLMRLRLSTSATSTTGMAKARLTCSSSDVVEKVKAAVATPDSRGGYADYLELLKLYDKNSNGTMMLAELDNILCNLGDEVPKEDVQKLFAELCDPEDEDGLFPYMSFLDRLT